MPETTTESAKPTAEPRPNPAAGEKDKSIVTPALVRAVADALDREDKDTLIALVDPLHAADFAQLLVSLAPQQRKDLVEALGSHFDPEVLSEVDEELRDELLEVLEPKALADAVKELDVEDAAYVLDDLEDSEKREVLAQVPVEDRAEVLDALLFPDDSAGRLMHREFVALAGAATVADALKHVSSDQVPEEFSDIYVLDNDGRPSGLVPLNRLLRASPKATLAEIASAELTMIPADTDRRAFAYLFEHYHLTSAPVTDANGRLVGVIHAGSVVEILQEMHQAEVLALGGVGEGESLAAPILKTTRLRFSWLFVNLLTAIMASIVIGFFEGSLSKIVALAVLMPIVASMGGNAGTQTLTVVVRALATKELTSANVRRVFNREVLIGLMNGIAFAVIAAAITWGWFRDWQLACVIALAMIINLLAAALAGILVPLTLNRTGVDPAVSSTVFVTTVTDVVGFFSFLGLATWVMLR
jgi:magnesium transporter